MSNRNYYKEALKDELHTQTEAAKEIYEELKEEAQELKKFISRADPYDIYEYLPERAKKFYSIFESYNETANRANAALIVLRNAERNIYKID